jgi:hypothetical protein
LADTHLLPFLILQVLGIHLNTPSPFARRNLGTVRTKQHKDIDSWRQSRHMLLLSFHHDDNDAITQGEGKMEDLTR